MCFSLFIGPFFVPKQPIFKAFQGTMTGEEAMLYSVSVLRYRDSLVLLQK